MARYPRLAAATLALAATGASYPGSLLSCHGSFGKFANGFLVAKPSQLKFIVDWQTPRISAEAGWPGRIIALTPIEIVFDIQYDGYKATYRVSRADGSITESSSLGGVFRGVCDLKALETRF
ncbi:MAG TPA: hypothetical protein VET89_12435 [Stellaceae bacterium]|nr:hypothetical protein [Stellaceae bacterium]